MVQWDDDPKYKLTEADFRGERFKKVRLDLRGNNDLLTFNPTAVNFCDS